MVYELTIYKIKADGSIKEGLRIRSASRDRLVRDSLHHIENGWNADIKEVPPTVFNFGETF